MKAGNRAGRVSWVVASSLGLALWLPGAEPTARACGGTFCDAGPTAMPVEQTGETILFVVDGPEIEAHIQIQYDPETTAEQFAWVVPVTALPEFSIGSQRLFTELLGASVPSYGMVQWNEPCDGGGEAPESGCDGTDGGYDEPSPHLDVPPPDDPGAPDVVVATTVGAFEVYVLDGGTAQGVMQWLADNDFAQDRSAIPILEQYLAEGHLFVAFRLAAQAEAAEIHPIVLRYEGSEPCVPIRLTRIAAKEDMEIRALFLGDERFSSSNYRHVTLNPLKLDWTSSAANYRDVVSMAIDEPGADGHAFVTEYAGPNPVESVDALVGVRWDSSAFRLAETPGEAVQQLLDQGLVGRAPPDFDCVALHPLIEGMVARYLPTPDDVAFGSICGDPLRFANAVDATAWDGDAFADELEQRVVEPGLHARELLETWPYLTRLYTMLSPHEMTEDPMFHATPELPDQPMLRLIGARNRFCDGAASFSLPDGWLVAATDGSSSWPDIEPQAMPWAETIAYLPARGAPVLEVDNRDQIAALLAAWHERVGAPRSPTASSLPSFCSGGEPGDGPQAQDDASDDGCGCRHGGGPWGAGLLGLLLVGLRRFRRAG